MDDVRDDELMPTIDDRAELESDTLGEVTDEPIGQADINADEGNVP